ncbi:MAG: GtrA family protein [Patescibacteria group bacterium]|jgi:putative flippase GtrA
MLKKFFFFWVNYVKNNWQQLWRYGIVGLTSAMIDFGILYLLTDGFGFHYLWSATISFIVAASYNYYLNKTWTFKVGGKLSKQVGIFLLIAGSGVLLNNLILYLLVEQAHWWYIYAKIIATGIVTIGNFIGNKYLTFKT